MILRQSAVYLVANLVSVVVGLLSVILFTRIMTPAEYGIYVIGLGSAAVVNGVLFTWLKLSLLRFQSEGDRHDLRRTVMLGYLLTASTLPLAFLVLMKTTSTSPKMAGAVIAYTLTVSLFEVGQEVLRARLLAAHFATGSIVRSLLALSLGVVAVSVFNDGLSLLVAAAAAYLLASALLARTIWGGTTEPVRHDVLRSMARFGAPLTLLGFTVALHLGLDRFILTYLYGTDVAGRFAAVNDFARQCIAVPCAGVFSAILPLAVRGAANDSAENVQVQLAYSAELIAAVTLPTAIGLALVSTHVSQLIFGVAFRATATEVLPILAFSWAAHLFWQHYVHVSFHLAKRPDLVIIQSGVSLLVGAVMILLAAMWLGNRGTAFAILATEVFALLLGLYMTRFGYRLPMPWDRFQRVALAGLTMAAATIAVETLIPGQGPIELVLLVITGGATYAIACLYFDVIDLRAKLRGKQFDPASRIGSRLAILGRLRSWTSSRVA